ncbi:hypothetical protein ACF0H5_012962 [Mactra antiquata]
MSALYSTAFDHLKDSSNENENDDYSYQDPEVVQSFQSFKGSGGRTSGAIRRKSSGVKENSTTIDDMGQDQSSQYTDTSEVNHRHHMIQSQHYERNFEPVLRGGHQNEDSAEYCYAQSVEEVATRRPKPPPQQRSVSLRDDYSQPHDRLSSFETTQDYIEPYQTKDNIKSSTKVSEPDPGIYSLAKEVDEIHKVEEGDSYNHTSGGVYKPHVASIRQDSYDRLSTWSNRIPASNNNTKQSTTGNPQSPTRRNKSNSSDEVFMDHSSVTKMNQEIYRDIPPNYEEPWDSQEGQKKFSRLITKAEKTHEKRQSVDQPPLSVGASRNLGAETKNIPSKLPLNNGGQIYEAAWETSSGKLNSPSSQPKSHNVIPSNYEDAWDLPEQQKQFEEKLLAARKQRASHGQIRVGENETMPSQEVSVRSPESPKHRMFPSSTDRVLRSDSCKSLGALAEKIDVDTPLEEQIFYHGAIKRSVAEKTLLVFKEGSYLVRKSETSKKDFSLTLKGWNGVPMHMKIACKPDGTYVLGENSPPFLTIPEMVNYYTTHELPVQNADRICLLYPIPS